MIAHIITDFLLQSKSMVAQRYGRKWASGWLYFHGLTAGLLAYTLSGLWGILWLPLVIFISHVVIDGVRAHFEDTARTFILDQVGHVIVILVCWTAVEELQATSMLSLMLPNLSNVFLWTVVLSYLFIFWPAGILIGKVTSPWRDELDESTAQGLPRAGMWIGRLERTLILTFVLLDHFEAIGFLIAAKSIFRFGELRSPESRKEAEYILIGTMFSFVIAILTGILARWIILSP